MVVLGAVNVGALPYYQEQPVRQERANVEGTAGDAAGSIDEQVGSRKDEVQLLAAKHPSPNRLNGSGPSLEQPFDTSRFWAAHVAANGTVVSAFGPYTDENRTALDSGPADSDRGHRSPCSRVHSAPATDCRRTCRTTRDL